MSALQQEALGNVVMDVYARRSFDKDGTTIHEDEQATECIERIEETPGWVLGQVFKDHALSAWKPKVNRPDFDLLMNRLESGASHGILVWDLSRFSRKPMEGERLLALAEQGIVVASLSTTYNLRSAEGRLQFRNKMAANAAESDTISERSRRGMRLKAKRGKPLATQRGFGRDGYLPRPKREDGQPDVDAMRVRVPEEQLARERAMIRDAAERIIAGEPLAKIADEWNAAGTLTVKGGRWDTGNLRHMLEAPAVAGQIEYKGKIVGTFPDPPLDLETWERLMGCFAARRRGRPSSTYLLSGLLYCVECGSKLYGRPRRGRQEYWCQLRSGSGCAKVNIDREFADRLVRRLVIKRLGDPKSAARIAKVAARVRDEASRLRAERERINGEMDALSAKAGTSPRWTFERVDAALANYEPQLERVEEQLRILEASPEAGMDSAIVDAEKDWDGGTDTDRRLLLRRAYPMGLEVTRAPNSKPETLTPDRIRPRQF